MSTIFLSCSIPTTTSKLYKNGSDILAKTILGIFLYSAYYYWLGSGVIRFWEKLGGRNELVMADCLEREFMRVAKTQRNIPGKAIGSHITRQLCSLSLYLPSPKEGLCVLNLNRKWRFARDGNGGGAEMIKVEKVDWEVSIDLSPSFPTCQSGCLLPPTFWMVGFENSRIPNRFEE